MIKFEPVEKYLDAVVPTRATANSAGYDFSVAEDTVVPSFEKLLTSMSVDSGISAEHDLKFMADFTKRLSARPTLVSTGVKCKLEPHTYLELSVRSSTPLKYWLVLANGVGIIDADYYNNPDNEGEIFFQLINLSPFDIKLKKGDKIGQGIIKSYLITNDDYTEGSRIGGFGSTSN